MLSKVPCKLSIVIPLYNGASHLRLTLQSIAKYCVGDFEVVIIDGNSSDDWRSIVNEFCDQFSIIALSEVDKGEYDAMNKGIMASNGNFLLFLMAADCLSRTLNCDNILGPLMFPVIRVNDGKKIKIKPHFLGLPNCHQGIIFRSNKNICYNLSFKLSSDYDFYLKHFNSISPPFHAEFAEVQYDEGHSGVNYIKRDREILAIVKNNFSTITFLFAWCVIKSKHLIKAIVN